MKNIKILLVMTGIIAISSYNLSYSQGEKIGVPGSQAIAYINQMLGGYLGQPGINQMLSRAIANNNASRLRQLINSLQQSNQSLTNDQGKVVITPQVLTRLKNFIKSNQNHPLVKKYNNLVAQAKNKISALTKKPTRRPIQVAPVRRQVRVAPAQQPVQQAPAAQQPIQQPAQDDIESIISALTQDSEIQDNLSQEQIDNLSQAADTESFISAIDNLQLPADQQEGVFRRLYNRLFNREQAQPVVEDSSQASGSDTESAIEQSLDDEPLLPENEEQEWFFQRWYNKLLGRKEDTAETEQPIDDQATAEVNNQLKADFESRIQKLTAQIQQANPAEEMPDLAEFIGDLEEITEEIEASNISEEIKNELTFLSEDGIRIGRDKLL